MASQHEGQTITYSTHAIQYKFRITERQHPVPLEPSPCTLVELALDNDRFNVPCFHSTDLTQMNSYLQRYHQWFTCFLYTSTFFEFAPSCCATDVAGRFINVLRSLNASHLCQDGEYTSSYRVELAIRPTSFEPDTNEDMDRVLRESFEEAARPKPKPATIESLAALVRARAREESEEVARKCVICMEEIKTKKSSLRMPCSHVFHQSCLVTWFLTNHVCPLCRYEMPCDRVLRVRKY